MLIDTNVLVAYFANERTVVDTLSEWSSEGKPLFTSPIIEAELLTFSSWDEKARECAKEYLANNYISIPFDTTLAWTTADIRRETKLKLPDAVIAATAKKYGVPVVTRNVKDFRRVHNLHIITI